MLTWILLLFFGACGLTVLVGGLLLARVKREQREEERRAILHVHEIGDFASVVLIGVGLVCAVGAMGGCTLPTLPDVPIIGGHGGNTNAPVAAVTNTPDVPIDPPPEPDYPPLPVPMPTNVTVHGDGILFKPETYLVLGPVAWTPHGSNAVCLFSAAPFSKANVSPPLACTGTHNARLKWRWDHFSSEQKHAVKGGVNFYCQWWYRGRLQHTKLIRSGAMRQE